MSGHVTTLLRGGNVYSPADPFATAMVVQGDTVAWVGSDEAAAAHAQAVDEVVHLGGALVTPAFVDAHVHATSTGLWLTGLDLTACGSLREALDRVEIAARATAGGPVLGHGWDETRWPERRPPSAAELDRASYGGVVYLSRIDAHSAVVSSALVAAAPELRALAGWRPDGVVSRAAHHAARRVTREAVPSWRRRDAQRATLRRAAAAGIGCIHELGGPDIAGEEDFTDLLALAAEEAGPDVVGYWGELGAVAKARDLGAAGAAGDLFVDGALGSRTAALSTPYADSTSSTAGTGDAAPTGALYLEVTDVRDHAVACTQGGLQAGFHAIGDAAVRTAIAGLAAAADVVGPTAFAAARHRLEHVEMLDGQGIATLARLGVVASVQPVFDALWGGPSGMYAARLGAPRARTLNPFAALAAAGVPLAFGSDAPVTPLGPWAAVRAAAQHHEPAHRLSVRAGFAAHTRGGWRAAGRDDGGVLVPGAPATYAVWSTGDLVVQAPDERVAAWSTDPRAGVPGLPSLEPDGPLPTCLRTVVRGRTIYSADGTGGP